MAVPRLGFSPDGRRQCGLRSDRNQDLRALLPDFVAPQAATRISQATTRVQVELPAMPGTSNDRTRFIDVLPTVAAGEDVGQMGAKDAALADGSALVRAAVAQRVQPVAVTKDPNRSVTDLDDEVTTFRQVVHGPDDVYPQLLPPWQSPPSVGPTGPGFAGHRRRLTISPYHSHCQGALGTQISRAATQIADV
jgi:hypothetical protein